MQVCISAIFLIAEQKHLIICSESLGAGELSTWDERVSATGR